MPATDVAGEAVGRLWVVPVVWGIELAVEADPAHGRSLLEIAAMAEKDGRLEEALPLTQRPGDDLAGAKPPSPSRLIRLLLFS